MTACAARSSACATTISISRKSPARSWVWRAREKLSIALHPLNPAKVHSQLAETLLNGAGHRDKKDGSEVLYPRRAVNLGYAHESLRGARISQRHHQAPPFAQLSP